MLLHPLFWIAVQAFMGSVTIAGIPTDIHPEIVAILNIPSSVVKCQVFAII
jgi:hypothetical protein